MSKQLTTIAKHPLFILFIIGLLVRSLVAFSQPHPRNLDEAYHTVNALTLAQGEGFTEHFIWNYLNPPDAVTHPGNLYWLPFSSLVALPGMLLLGLTYSAGQLGFILLAAFLPVLGYLTAYNLSGQARYGWVVGLLMIFSGFYFSAWTVIDGFTPFALAGSLCFYASWQMLQMLQGSHQKASNRLTVTGWALLTGLMAGVGHLTRADGLLLLLTVILFLGWSFLKPPTTSPDKTEQPLTTPQNSVNPPQSDSVPLTGQTVLTLAALILVGYALVMGPWFIRNIQVIGAPLPPGGLDTIWLTSYNDLFGYQRDLSWQSYFDLGWATILRGKLWALGINLQTLWAVQGLIVALPLAIVGWWQQRRHPLLQITLLYTSLLVAAMTLVFTFPGPRGALFHSGGAILPVLFTAAMFGLDDSLKRLGRRRPVWRRELPRQVFSGAMVFFAIVISLFTFVQQQNALATQLERSYAALVTHLAGESATVMLGNPPAYIYYGGHQAIMIPTESIEVTLRVARLYGADYLALDQNFAQHPLSPYLTDQANHPNLTLEQVFPGPIYLYRLKDNEL